MKQHFDVKMFLKCTMNQRQEVLYTHITDTVYNTVIHYVIYHVQLFWYSSVYVHTSYIYISISNAQTNTDTV